MDSEKRKGDSSISDKLEEMLNKAQRKALPGIKFLRWEPQFLRKPLFKAPVLVLRNSNDDRTGIIDEDGRLIVQDGIKAREQENDTQTPPSPKNLHYY